MFIIYRLFYIAKFMPTKTPAKKVAGVVNNAALLLEHVTLNQ